MLTNAWQNPKFFRGDTTSKEEVDKQFEEFYEDMYCEACTYGPVSRMLVCDNGCDHLMGNVYIQYKHEDDALKAAESMNDRWYNEKPVRAEVVPVTDFRDAICRQIEDRSCKRGRLCNYVHPIEPSAALAKDLYKSQRAYLEIKSKQRNHRNDARKRRRYN